MYRVLPQVSLQGLTPLLFICWEFSGPSSPPPLALHLSRVLRKSGCHCPWYWWELQIIKPWPTQGRTPTPGPGPTPNQDEKAQPVSFPSPIKPFVDLLGSHPRRKPYYVSGKSFQTHLVCVSCCLDQLLGERIHPTSAEWLLKAEHAVGRRISLCPWNVT